MLRWKIWKIGHFALPLQSIFDRNPYYEATLLQFGDTSNQLYS